ncbi:PD-(D/E)XK nuclease family protein [Apibacter muscae]|uniref:PD-(D/E)XK nuclease family protein n=1 Tax=Apibacter muscae TaxID=2509004 RepID=UPI0011ACBE18|nr:PD-(D/E)XK nuclease family protein [Apibacter muscae]TWP23448.1 PD-(D/E)XK nuclease family protein [Apibacter muscae]
MANSFIEKIIQQLLDSYKDLSSIHLVLPGKRPIIFFKKFLIDHGYQGFLPTFYTIEDFIEKYSKLTRIENIPLWLEAYKIQKKYINTEEKLDDFLKWIPTLLKDFNDIELFSENPIRVLEHLASIERMENWAEKLDSKNEEKLYHKNLKFWENNLILYQELKKSLFNQGLGTSGMLLSTVVDNLERLSIKPEDIFVFAGFNALTPKEEKLIKYFISHSTTLLFWDTDEYYMNQSTQEAGFFLRKNILWNYYANREFLWKENQFSKKKNIQVIGTSQEVAQAKYTHNILENIPQHEWEHTALVLCDETLLPSVIESLPQEIQKVNITMGYSLKNSLVASFFKQIFGLHIFREKNKTQGFYYKDVLAILQHPLLEYNQEIADFCKEIQENNLVFISDSLLYKKLNTWNLLFVFKEYKDPLQLVKIMSDYCSQKFWNYNEDEGILKENFLKFKNIFSLLYTQLSEQSLVDTFSLLQSLYQHILNNEKIDFIGEPLQGLQIMGVLETRLLGFKNLIMLGVNEGIIPEGKKDNSFIPFDVKKNYNIHTFLENDAIYAYHFYRLLQHAEQIYLLYNNFTEGLYSGEKSRFISQLEFESPHQIQEITVSYSGSVQQQPEFKIDKTPALVKTIQQWLKKPISPTHLTSYHYNPINFYLQKLVQLEENTEVEEEISPLNYGNLIHHTLEALYTPLKGQYLTEDALKNCLSDYKVHLQEYIKKELNPDLFERGQNYLQKLLAEKTLEKIILRDLTDIQQGNSIYLQDIEKSISSKTNLENLGKIQLKGFVDRWDVFNGQDRIIDYKTSSVGSLAFSSDKRDKIQENTNFKFFIQLVFYAYMILNEKTTHSVQVGIWSFKKPFRGLEVLSYDKQTLITYPMAIDLFKEVETIIQEIANPHIPFIEKTYVKFR